MTTAPGEVGVEHCPRGDGSEVRAGQPPAASTYLRHPV